MKFSTETLEQVVALLQADWEAQGYDTERLDMAALERHIQEGGQDIQRQLLGALLEAEDERRHQGGATCPQAGCASRRLRREGRRPAQVLSRWGPVPYRRSVYVCPQGHRHIPLDREKGLRPGQPTPHMEHLLALSGAALPFEQARQWVGLVLQVNVSGNTIRRSTQAWGKQIAEEEEARYTQSTQPERRLQRQARIGKPKRRVYASIDGGFVPLQGEKEGERQWREAKMVAWYQEGAGQAREARMRDVHLHGTLEAKERRGVSQVGGKVREPGS